MVKRYEEHSETCEWRLSDARARCTCATGATNPAVVALMPAAIVVLSLLLVLVTR